VHRAAFADGMFPEARTPDSTEAVRHWFAWPGAAFGAFWSLDQRDEWDLLRAT
jgi:hypothetical protein